MNYEHLIGKHYLKVKTMLEKNNINIITKDNNSGSRNFDTELVVRVKKIDSNTVEVITNKFLLSLEE